MGLFDAAARIGWKKAAPAIGGALGGLSGGISSAFDGEDGDAFEDTIKGAGMGALGFGGLGLGFNLASKLAKGGTMAKLGSKGLYGGGLLAGFSGLTSPIGNALDTGDKPKGTAPQRLSGVLSGSQPSGGSTSLFDLMSAQSGSGLGPEYGFLGAPDPEAPDLSLPSLSKLMLDPELNKVANQQIITANAATMREISGIKKRRDLELQQNEGLGEEYQRRSDEIEAGNLASTKAIADHHAARQDAVDAETDAMAEATGAALAGNDSTRAEYAAQAALQGERLNEARVADSELLERLGLGGQTILQDLAAAEQAETQNRALNIRDQAADTIDEKNTETADRWRFDKPQILGALAQEQQKLMAAQRQMGLQLYQSKLAAANQRRQDMLTALNANNSINAQMMGYQMQYGGQQAGGLGPSQIAGDSGFTFKNEFDDSTQNIPEYALMTPQEAQAAGVSLAAWEMWQPAVNQIRSAMAG